MMYSVLLVVALAAQGYARPNCFFTCDYPGPSTGNLPVPGNIGQPIYPGPRPSGNIVQPGYPGTYNPSVDVFNPIQVNPGYVQPPHVETYPSTAGGSHVTFNHESSSSSKTSINGVYTYPAPQPPVNEPYRQPPRPCRHYTDCS